MRSVRSRTELPGVCRQETVTKAGQGVEQRLRIPTDDRFWRPCVRLVQTDAADRDGSAGTKTLGRRRDRIGVGYRGGQLGPDHSHGGRGSAAPRAREPASGRPSTSPCRTCKKKTYASEISSGNAKATE